MNDISEVSLIENLNDSKASALTGELDRLAQQGAKNYDPVRYYFIENMIKKAISAEGAVRSLLESRIEKAIQQYSQAFTQALQKAKADLQVIKTLAPEKVEQAEVDFQQGNFKQISKIKTGSERQQQIKALSALKQYLIDRPEANTVATQDISFEDFLLEQEKEIIKAVCGEADNTQNGAEPDKPQELRSMKMFRDSWVKSHSEKIVQQAIDEAPENAGPLNSHMLAIRSLTAMRDLSPEYLNRFVSYIDTLLWLDKAGEEAGLYLRKKSR